MLNDDINLMNQVAYLLHQCCALSVEDAVRVMRRVVRGA